MSSCGAQSNSKMENVLKGQDMPIFLFYGDSHLTRLKDWFKVAADEGGQKKADRDVLCHQHFCAVSGSKFKSVHDRVQGINVPDTQPFRGNLWRYTVNFKELKPDYIVVSLGANDASSLDQEYQREMRKYINDLCKKGPDNIKDKDYLFCDPDH